MPQSQPNSAFLGFTQKHRSTDWVRLTFLSHTSGKSIPSHDHEWAMISRLLTGNYVSRTRTREFEILSGEALYSPSCYEHRDVIGKTGARFLCIEISPQLLEDNGIKFSAPTDHKHLRNEACIYASDRLLSAFLRDADSMELDCLAAELFATLHPGKEHNISQSLFATLVERLTTDLSGDLKLAELAILFDVHPTTLTRQFRRKLGMSIGEFRQRVRARISIQEVMQDNAPLAQIAIGNGYADQSHMTRDFIRRFKTTPAKIRRRIRIPEIP